MAVFYNTNGSVSEIVINAMIDGKVTSSLASGSVIQQAFEASASNAIINKAIAAGSSSAQAYNLAYPSGSTNNNGYNYLSSTTTKKVYSGNSYAVLNPNDPNASKGDRNYSITINGTASLNNTTFDRDRNPVSESMAFAQRYPNDLTIYKGDFTGRLTTASLVIKKITNSDKAALGLPSVGAHALPVFYSSASWADLGNSSLYSASIATGSIMKLSVSRSYFDFNFSSGSANKLSLVSSKIDSNLNSFNILSGSVSASVEYSHFVLFVSSSRALMGELISENTYISKPI